LQGGADRGARDAGALDDGRTTGPSRKTSPRSTARSPIATSGASSG
jgi:hypothetical protein